MEGSRHYPPSAAAPLGAPPVSLEREQRSAAEAIADAELALAQQNSVTSQLDLQVVSAILNAHVQTVEGREELNELQQEIEAAVRTRSDLDTPAGARDFQRFLIGKLRDIRAVVANARLDDTSKSALMAAWTSLYNAARNGPALGGHRTVSMESDVGPTRSANQQAAAMQDAKEDPFRDSLFLGDPGLLVGDAATSTPTAPTMPTASALPSIPNFGSPGGGTTPASMPSWNMPAGLPLSGLLDRGRTGFTSRGLDEGALESEDQNPNDPVSPDESGSHKVDDDKAPFERLEAPPGGPTTLTLPDGETVTAASPQLAAAIKAATGGASIAEAFQQQGITIPAPGTAVTNPIEPSRVIPGDIGIFTDRYALALGHGKALLDGQIQHMTAVSGSSFLGWQHPPSSATATAPARAEAPTPTRPAAGSH